jgi:chromosome segregation ATPase
MCETADGWMGSGIGQAATKPIGAEEDRTADMENKENHAPRNTTTNTTSTTHGTPAEAELQSQWHATSAELAAAKVQRKGLQHDLDALQRSIAQRQAELQRLAVSVEAMTTAETATSSCQTVTTAQRDSAAQAAVKTAAAGVQCVMELEAEAADTEDEEAERQRQQTRLELAAANEAVQEAREEAERVRVQCAASVAEAQAAADKLRRQAEEAQQKASAARGEVAEAKAWLSAHREQRAVSEALQKVRSSTSETCSTPVPEAWRVGLKQG